MPRYEELGRFFTQQSPHRRVVVARIATDMLDEHIGVLAFEAIQLTIHQSQVATIAVATDGPQRSKRRQPVCHLHGADVTCMPNLVAGFEVVQVLVVPITVRIADDAYSLHDLKF